MECSCSVVVVSQPETIRDSQETSPRGFLFMKLPPPPCAVLLVYQIRVHLCHTVFVSERSIQKIVDICYEI